jgi:anti-anti-sigma factor
MLIYARILLRDETNVEFKSELVERPLYEMGIRTEERDVVEGIFMEAKFYQKGEITVVALSGRLEIEKNHAFRQACMQSLKGKKVVFCMKDLNFVGSTGIQGFFQVIREFNHSNSFRAKIAELKPDFHRLLFSAGTVDIEVFENVAGALTANFQMPAMVIA